MHPYAKSPVQIEVRRQHLRVGVFLSGLPDNFAGLYSAGLRRLVLCKDSAMPLFHIATHGQGPSPQLRLVQFLDAGLTGI